MVRDSREAVTMVERQDQYVVRCHKCNRVIHAASFPVRITRRKDGDEGHFAYCRHCKIAYTVNVD